MVDGCDQHCAKKCLEAISCDLEFHLSLADLGILKTESSEISYDELQMVKDAIIAESTRLSNPPHDDGGVQLSIEKIKAPIFINKNEADIYNVSTGTNQRRPWSV